MTRTAKITQILATGEDLWGFPNKKGCILSPGEEMTDEELMHRFQQGHRDAYEQVVLRNMELVMRMAMRYIPDPASAEDISQQVFVRIWQSKDQFREARSFKGWISTITRNLSLNEIRTRKRKNWNPRSAYSDQDQSTEAGAEWLGGSERFDNPHEQMETSEQLASLRKAMDELTQNEHDAIYLQNIEGWPLDKISDHLGISVPATKSLLFRTRKKLAQKLAIRDRQSEQMSQPENRREHP